MLDHVVEAEVVTADGAVVRASEGSNADLFFAVRGAAAGFGVVTEFAMRTHASPGNVVQYAYVYSFGGPEDSARVYMQWQDVATDPTLDRRFGTDLTFHALGVMISGTFYGSKTDFEQSGILERLPRGGMGNYVVTDWLASLVTRAEHAAIRLANLPTPFYCKSLGLTRSDLLSYDAILDIVRFMRSAEKKTPLWFVIFSATGGAVADVPMAATAYAHRDKVIFYESYVVGIPFIPGGLPRSDHKFLSDLHEVVRANLPHDNDTDRSPYGRTYPGYVDRELPEASAQEYYWGDNLPRLRQIKREWDPRDVFHNAHSVRPAEKGGGEAQQKACEGT